MPRYRRPKSRLPGLTRYAYGMTVLWIILLGYILFMPVAYRPRYLSTLILPGGLTLVIWVLALLELWWHTRREQTLEQLISLEPSQFEEWVAQRFREQGYKVTLSGMSGDHGADLVLEKDGQRAIVQCKRYAKWKVGEPALRDLYGAMYDFGADHAYMVTTGPVTAVARAWAQGKPITIIDGQQLSKMVDAAPTVPAPVERAPEHGVCTRCGTALVIKHNRRTGEPFLACPEYPRCRYTRPLPR